MSWIKRNLFFVIGSVVALILMGLAGYFLYSKWSLNNDVLANLNSDYEQLKTLNSANPHPGAGSVNNIQLAKEQRQQLLDYLKKTRPYFQASPRIPDIPKVTDRDFSAALSQAIERLHTEATNASVGLPPDNYSFSFTAQRKAISFAPGSLDRLAEQLGEINLIAEVFFSAKINALDNIRRERVSKDDSFGPMTDYISDHSITNTLAVLTPYEVTFRSFSSELATVLAGFASSPHAFLVKTVNVELAPAQPMAEPTSPVAMQSPVYVQPNPMQEQMSRSQREAQAAASFRSRYGLSGGAGMGGVQYRGLGGQTPQQSYYYPQATAQAGITPTGKGGLPTVLDEKLLKITLNLYLVKPLPSK